MSRFFDVSVRLVRRVDGRIAEHTVRATVPADCDGDAGAIGLGIGYAVADNTDWKIARDSVSVHAHTCAPVGCPGHLSRPEHL
jgi:hypothetical protein